MFVCVHRAGIVLNGTAAADAPIAGKLYSFHFLSSFSQKLRGLPAKFGGGVPTGWPVGHGKPWLSLGFWFLNIFVGFAFRCQPILVLWPLNIICVIAVSILGSVADLQYQPTWPSEAGRYQ